MKLKLTLISTILTGTILAAGTVYLATAPTAALAASTDPAYAGSRTYEVTFATGHSHLTPAAEKVIAEAAASAKSSPSRILLRAHADTTGSVSANYELSTKRSAAVKAMLVKQGIPEANITDYPHGETATLPVGTPEAHPEKMNRSVEIVVIPEK